MDQSYELVKTGAKPRPENLIVGQGSDEIMVCRKYKIEGGENLKAYKSTILQ
jgi:hypothetical protein